MDRFSFISGLLSALALLLAFWYSFQEFLDCKNSEPLRIIDMQAPHPPVVKRLIILGAVKRPGNVILLTDPPRVYEAVQNAGGFTELANISVINLSEDLTAVKILSIPTTAEKKLGFIKDPQAQTKKKKKKKVKQAQALQSININTASKQELTRLPGIGEKLAKRIIEQRAKGHFKSEQELLRIKGIGKKKLAAIKHFIVF